MNEERLLDTKALAAFLGVRVNFLAQARMAGDGPPFIKLRDGSRSAVRYRMTDVEKWLCERGRLSTSDKGDLNE